MTKKEYMKPTMRTVELKNRMKILSGSNFGVNRTLQNDADLETPDEQNVTYAW